MKHLLVIAYYFPPMGLSGVQRIAKFVKYLPENGWAPTVLTVDPGGYFAFDPSLLGELNHSKISIIRTPSFDPTRLFRGKTTVALPKESSRKWLSNLSQFVFVPDNKVGWYRPAMKKAIELHSKNSFDCILATAPPYTCSLIAHRVSKHCNVPYVLDFRDDWIGNPRHVYPTPLHKMIHKRLERRVFKHAGSIVTVNDVIAHLMKTRHPGKADLIQVLNQGYDPVDFDHPSTQPAHNKFKILYSGVFYDVQTPDYFLRALAEFLTDCPNARSHFEATFVGLLPETSQNLIAELGLKNVVTYNGYAPHNQAIQELKTADVLWMTVGNGPGQDTISTSKLFEYIGAQKPILGLVPAGAARKILTTYDASFLAFPEDIEGIKRRLHELYALWQKGQLPRPSSNVVQSFDRRLITSDLASILNSIA